MWLAVRSKTATVHSSIELQQHNIRTANEQLMASTNTFSPSPPVNNNAPSIELSSRTINKATTGGGGAPFLVRISRKTNGYERTSCSANLAFATDGGGRGGEGPSCIFVGPIETASKETLEALYRQARDAYYSGKPLIVDDMFDKVELKLRWYGSKSVVKYPRCSLRRQSTYSDAEEDASQVWALASLWILILAFGSLAFLVPTIYAILLAYQDMFNARLTSNGSTTALESLAMPNRMLLILIGSIVGYPIASASVGALQGLWKNDLVALKGACPSCGEEVFAFVKADQSKQIPHKADCHVCESSLEYRPRVEDSISAPSKRWVHGRIYLLRQRGKNRHQRRMY